MKSPHTIQQTAKRIKLLSAVAAMMAFPAALGFARLWLIEGQHGGLLGFALIWLLVAGVSFRVYAQFLRWWHRVGYSPAAVKAATVPPPRTPTARAGPPSAIPVAIEERSPALTCPRRSGTDGAREEAEAWREALRKEWERARSEARNGQPSGYWEIPPGLRKATSANLSGPTTAS